MYRTNPNSLEVFQALSDVHRLRIVTIMLSQSEVCLCDLSDAFDEPDYKLSRHIKVLKNAGIITSFRSGKWIYHSLVEDKSLKGVYEAIRSSPEYRNSASRSYLKKLKKRRAGYKNRLCEGAIDKSLETKKKA